ncbi:MAG: MFS transporter, partial [Calditrichota bacterium]
MITSVSNKKQSLLPILTVNFVGTLGFSIVLPFLIFLVTRFGGNAVVYGILGATYSAFQLFGAPILGRWSDRYGRRKILLLSQAGTLLSWLIFMVAMFIPLNTLTNIDSSWLGTFTLTLPLLLLFIARALDGLTGGNVSVAYAYLSDITDKNSRSENFGRMAVAANLGFIFGPAIAGLLGATEYGEKLPVLATISISITAIFIIGFLLPESKATPVSESPDGDNVRRMLGQEQK